MLISTRETPTISRVASNGMIITESGEKGETACSRMTCNSRMIELRDYMFA